MELWIKNTSGKKDAMLTFALMGLLVVLTKTLASGFHFTIDESVYQFGAIDGTTVAAILTPTLGAYVSRRYTDRRHGGDPLPGSEPAQKNEK